MSKDNPREHTPHIESPDTLPIDNGMMCWRDRDRVCNGSCVAYNPEGEAGTPNVCVLLVYKGQQAMAAMHGPRPAQAPFPMPKPPDGVTTTPLRKPGWPPGGGTF